MTTTFSTTGSNPHIAALEPILHEAAKPIEYLIIAHNDPLMLQTLCSALGGTSAAILEASQDTWKLSEGDLPEMIEWALQRGEIKHLLLVGHSQAGGSESRASLAATVSADAEPGYAKLLANVKRQNARNQQARQSFASQVQQMSQIPAVHTLWASDELAVHGLFYRSESGLFVIYDPNEDSFRPLMAN